jgi:hypothetical protein
VLLGQFTTDGDLFMQDKCERTTFRR